MIIGQLNPKPGVETADGAEGADKPQLGNEVWVKVRSQRHKSNPFNIREIREICGSYFGVRAKNVSKHNAARVVNTKN
jgi:hypothetical protein